MINTKKEQALPKIVITDPKLYFEIQKQNPTAIDEIECDVSFEEYFKEQSLAVL